MKEELLQTANICYTLDQLQAHAVANAHTHEERVKYLQDEESLSALKYEFLQKLFSLKNWYFIHETYALLYQDTPYFKIEINIRKECFIELNDNGNNEIVFFNTYAQKGMIKKFISQLKKGFK